MHLPVLLEALGRLPHLLQMAVSMTYQQDASMDIVKIPRNYTAKMSSSARSATPSSAA